MEVRERIPGDIYRQCVAIAGSYYSMLKRRRELEEQILCGSPCSDGQPKGSGTGNPTACKAERLVVAKERNEWKIRAVEYVLETAQSYFFQGLIPIVFGAGSAIYALDSLKKSSAT